MAATPAQVKKRSRRLTLFIKQAYQKISCPTESHSTPTCGYWMAWFPSIATAARPDTTQRWPDPLKQQISVPVEGDGKFNVRQPHAPRRLHRQCK